MENTKGGEYNLLLGTFRSDTRGKLFVMSTVSHWKNLPRELASWPTLDAFSIQLDRAGPACLDQAVPRKVGPGEPCGAIQPGIL